MNCAILVDGANFIHALNLRSDPGTGAPLKFDVDRFEIAVVRQTLGFGYCVQKSFYFNYRDEDDLKRLRGFRSVLDDRGWATYANPCKDYGNGQFKDKRTDIMMILDAYDLALSGRIQSLAIVTHDADFAPLMERIPRGVARWAVGWRSGMSRELREAANVAYIDDFWREIRRSV